MLLPRPGGTLLKLQACSGLTIITPYKGFRWRPHIRRWHERPGRSIRNAARAACPAYGATKIEPGGCDMLRILVFNGTPQAAESRLVEAGSRTYDTLIREAFDRHLADREDRLLHAACGRRQAPSAGSWHRRLRWSLDFGFTVQCLPTRSTVGPGANRSCPRDLGKGRAGIRLMLGPPADDGCARRHGPSQFREAGRSA
jgi:hypothetical protein